MSVYERNSGKYAVLIENDSGPNGLRRRRSLGTYATKKEAQKAERDALTSRDRGIDIAPGTVTVTNLLSRYLQNRASLRTAKTMQEYEGISRRYVTPKLGALLLSKLRPAHIAEWQSRLLTDGGSKGQALAAKTTNHARSLLHGALDWAVKMQLVAVNACDAVDAPKVRRSKAKALTQEEIACITETSAKTRWASLVTLALSIGARRGELLALKWEAVDFDRLSITIRTSLSQTKIGGVALKDTKTDAIHTVPLSRVAIEALKRQHALQAADKLHAGGFYRDEHFIFANELGGRLSPMAATNAYARLARKASLSSTRLHDTRHTTATTLLTSGVDIRTVAGILGHSSPVVTMTTYAHLLPEAQRDAVDKLGAALEKAIDRNKSA
jgi:integrase